MLKRFYTGAGFGRYLAPGTQNFTIDATMHYAREERYTYLGNDGNITNVDPSGTWGNITGGYRAAFVTQNILDLTGRMLTGDSGAIYRNYPKTEQIIPDMEIWFFNFETIPKSAMTAFLRRWSDHIRTFDSQLGRRAWIIFNPAWEFNQDSTARAGGGWGVVDNSVVPFVRGWNIPGEDYSRQIRLWVEARNELGIDNIVIAAHALVWPYRGPGSAYGNWAIDWQTKFAPYLDGFKQVDILGFSDYQGFGKTLGVQGVLVDGPERADYILNATGVGKPVFFFEWNSQDTSGGYPQNATAVNAMYESLSEYPNVRAYMWWSGGKEGYDQTFYEAFVSQTARWNAFRNPNANST